MTGSRVSPEPMCRADEREKAKKDKHGDSEYEEPASERRAKDMAKRKQKEEGRKGRRKFHDAKNRGERDRSKRQLEEDYNTD